VPEESERPACGCGFYSIGRCSECREPFCGDHYMDVRGMRYCRAHGTAVLDRERTTPEMQEAAKRREINDHARAERTERQRLEDELTVLLQTALRLGRFPADGGSVRLPGGKRWARRVRIPSMLVQPEERESVLSESGTAYTRQTRLATVVAEDGTWWRTGGEGDSRPSSHFPHANDLTAAVDRLKAALAQ